ncbi:MAG TPA: hypothetical protein VK153_00105 [Candidatus Paceibacterota bacterium]|nr:hypothetical protein [Candidatus Paceibacterota bacterium]
MARLPTVGQDNNEWGTILNEYLAVEHNEDGSQKFLTESVSRTIYVSATGDDTTGDGSEALPYLTIGKALSTINKTIVSGITVTISLGVGTFSMSNSDLNALSFLLGTGNITLQGTLTLIESGFTMGSAEALDPLTYAVSGGNTASWTTNQYKYYFLKSGTSYYPITHNTSTTLSITNSATTGTEIYQAQSILNFTNTADVEFASELTSINFNSLKIEFPAYNLTFNKCTVKFQTCHFRNVVNTKYLSFNFFVKPAFSFTSIENWRIIGKYFFTAFTSNYLYINTNASLLQISDASYNPRNMRNIVYENPNTGTSATCLYLGYNGYFNYNHSFYIKFVNSNIAIQLEQRGTFKFKRGEDTKLIIKNTNYLCKLLDGVDNSLEPYLFEIDYTNCYGTPLIRWFFYQLYQTTNSTSGLSISIHNLLYPEFEANLSSTLADNATTNVIIGNKLQNQSIVIDYTIKRGTTYETAQLRILNDGTNLTLQEGTPLGDAGVTFAVNFNTNEIRLACTLTSTGTAATLKYNATRVMITPLTI